MHEHGTCDLRHRYPRGRGDYSRMFTVSAFSNAAILTIRDDNIAICSSNKKRHTCVQTSTFFGVSLSIRNLATMLFLVMAVIQFNDPDPAYWITTYTLTGICAHGPRLGLLLLPVVWTTAGLVLAGLLLSLPGFIQFVSLGQWSSLAGTMSTSQPQIEFAREFLGLLFCVVCLVVVIRQNGLLATTTQSH